MSRHAVTGPVTRPRSVRSVGTTNPIVDDGIVRKPPRSSQAAAATSATIPAPQRSRQETRASPMPTAPKPRTETNSQAVP